MPGMTATITIITTDKKGVLLVPNEALRFAPSFNTQKYDKTGVWVLPSENEQPRRVDVSIGIISENVTEITEGDLKEGDKVVLAERGHTSAAIANSSRPRGPGGRR